MLVISQVNTDSEIETARVLLVEYTTWALTLEADSRQAPTFQGLDEELRTLPGIYSPPAGRLLLATHGDQPAGCVCLKPHDARTCELKRLYVRPTFRASGIGRQLVQMLVQEARQAGYSRIELNSHISMTGAHAIYRTMGFRIVATPPDFPETLKPIVVFMECHLA